MRVLFTQITLLLIGLIIELGVPAFLSKENQKRFVRLLGLLLILSALVWCGFELLAGVLVPAWSLLLAIFISLIAGYSVCLKWGHVFRFYKGFSIPFDYAPDSPGQHGWEVVAENDDKQLPSFSSVEDALYGNVIQISSTKLWYMDYFVDYPQNEYKRVEFIVNPARSKQTLYVSVQVKSKHGTKEQEKWFKLRDPASPVKDHSDNEKEVPAKYNHKDGGWLGIEANIRELMEMTYSKEGWILKRILRLRIRDTVQIASIELYP